MPYTSWMDGLILACYSGVDKYFKVIEIGFDVVLYRTNFSTCRVNHDL